MRNASGADVTRKTIPCCIATLRLSLFMMQHEDETLADRVCSPLSAYSALSLGTGPPTPPCRRAKEAHAAW